MTTWILKTQKEFYLDESLYVGYSMDKWPYFVKSQSNAFRYSTLKSARKQQRKLLNERHYVTVVRVTPKKPKKVDKKPRATKKLEEDTVFCVFCPFCTREITGLLNNS